MASTCICSCCTKDAIVEYPIIPRANYTNLYKRPESDAEFVLRSINSKKGIKLTESDTGTPGNTSGRFLLAGAGDYEPRVVDSVSCRQMYLKSYTFSREEERSSSTGAGNTLPEKTRKCVEKVIKKVKMMRNINVRNARAAVCDGSRNLVSLSQRKVRSIRINRYYYVGRRKRLLVLSRKLISKATSSSYSAILSMLRRLLVACTRVARIARGRC